MKRFFSLILTVMLLLVCAMPALADSYKDAYDHVVRFYQEEYVTYCLADGTIIGATELNNAYIGSGFAIGKVGEPVKYFVTNNHVVETPATETGTVTLSDGSTVRVYAIYSTQLYIVFTNKTEMVPVNVRAMNDRCDIAVVELNEPTTLRTPALLKPQTAEELMYQTVYSAGFPGISDNHDKKLTGNPLNSYYTDMTTTSGMVNTVKSHAITEEGETIQHNAKISGGNSGGPLLNEKGHVIGVNYATWSADGDYALAVTTNELVRFLDAEQIPYTLAGDNTNLLIYILIGVGVLVVAAAVLFVVTNDRKKGGNGKNKHTSGSGKRTLTGVVGALAAQTFEIKGTMKIGTDPSRSQLIFPAGTPGVSGLHCSINFDGKVVTVTDENSRYGTWLDQTRLTPGTPVVMHRGQTLYFGSQKQSMKLGS